MKRYAVAVFDAHDWELTIKVFDASSKVEACFSRLLELWPEEAVRNSPKLETMSELQDYVVGADQWIESVEVLQ